MPAKLHMPDLEGPIPRQPSNPCPSTRSSSEDRERVRVGILLIILFVILPLALSQKYPFLKTLFQSLSSIHSF